MRKFITGFFCGGLVVITSCIVIAMKRPSKWVETTDDFVKQHREETEKYANGWINDERGSI